MFIDKREGLDISEDQVGGGGGGNQTTRVRGEQTRNEERSDDNWCQSTADLESVQFIPSQY